jgi:hypothetical protein
VFRYLFLITKQYIIITRSTTARNLKVFVGPEAKDDLLQGIKNGKEYLSGQLPQPRHELH